jgi:hypothetical protein
MNCPACGSDRRVPLGQSRYRCLAPSSAGPTTFAPPSLGSAWATAPTTDPTAGTCGTIYVDAEERGHHRRTQLILDGC